MISITHKGHIKIISKIENEAGLKNFDDILEKSTLPAQTLDFISAVGFSSDVKCVFSTVFALFPSAKRQDSHYLISESLLRFFIKIDTARRQWQLNTP